MQIDIQRLVSGSALAFAIVAVSLPARSQDLPLVATTDSTLFATRIDVEQIDPDALQAAAKAVLGPSATLVDQPLDGLRKFRQELDRLGVRKLVKIGLVGSAAELTESSRSLQLFAFRGGIDREATAKQMPEFWYGDVIAEYFAAEWLDDWLGVHVKDEPLPAAAKPGRHSKRIAAALTSLGKRPGVVIVPSEKVLKMAEPMIASLKSAGLPASISVVVDEVLAAQWSSAAAKIDAKPAVKVTLQMVDEAQATKLAADYVAMSKDLAKLTSQLPAKDEDKPPTQAALIGELMVYAQTLRPEAKGTQVVILLDPQGIRRTIDTFVMPAIKAGQVAAKRNESSNRLKLLAIMVMRYEQANGKLPDKIEDLKTLLSGTEAEREAEFKTLTTNPQTGLSPGYAYTRPAKRSRDLKVGARQTVILHELKGGKPDPDGLLGYLDGSIRTKADDAQQELERESEADR